MSHAVYTTEAIICGSFDRKSANRSYLLFTEAAGMLYAEAQSVREERSKQRYALQDFSIVRVSLVRGKGGWRIGSVEALENPFMEAASRAARASVVSCVKLVRRYVHGEEPVRDLYPLVRGALARLKAEPLPHRTDAELRFAFSVLARLGYVPDEPALRGFLVGSPAALCEPLAPRDRALLEGAVEAAVAASHL